MEQAQQIPAIKLSSPKPLRQAKSQKRPGGPTPSSLPNLAELTNLVVLLRQLGVEEFSQADLHLKLGPVGTPLSVPEALPSVEAGPPQSDYIPQEVMPEDMLFWSTDTFETKEEDNKDE